MIRNVVLGRLRPADDAAGAERDRQQLERGLAGIAGLRLPGQLEMRIGTDAGLRAGAWSFGITNDWVDSDAYHAYDVDAEHNVYRTMVGEVCAEIARVQLEL